LADALNLPLSLLGMVRVPADESLSSGALATRRLRESLEPEARQQRAEVLVRVAHDPWPELLQLVSAAGTLLLLPLRVPLPPERVTTLPCDTVLLDGHLPERPRRILLPVRGGPYAELALHIAVALADRHGAEITLLHAASAGRLGDELYQGFLQHLREIPAITRWITVRGDVVKAIEADAHEHDLLIMGAAARLRATDSPAGPVTMRAVAAAGLPALVVRSRRPFPLPATADIVPLDYTISVVVDKWFAENSFHAGEFADLDRLLDLKRRQGLTVSLALPALNEAANIGNVIRTMQRALVDECPLLDEIVVIDSMSTDDTVAIAESLGVPVHQHPRILPEMGSHRGKGEALWKSLAVLKGDLIAWVDTDIVNIDPRFVYGVLGPLITNPRLQYVKGYYQRPLREGDHLEPGEGGRVTELVARPLLNLFFPELSGLVQPLSGEYAGRRAALWQIPFFTGYGVEMGMLIDILNTFGLGAIGQVDLEERVHRNQPLSALSRMAFAIIQVAMQRVGERRGLALMDAMQQSLKQILYGQDHFQLEVRAIRDAERPPMATVLGL
jgi:glucosyl-3-phosphoglycerate synthase